MKASKFSEAQIAFVLKQAKGSASIVQVCRKVGVSQATFYNWRKKYAGLIPSSLMGYSYKSKLLKTLNHDLDQNS